MNISVIVHVTLRRHVCVVLQVVDLLQRTAYSTIFDVGMSPFLCVLQP